MRNMEISKGLRADIDSNQNQLKAAIRNHQALVERYSRDPNNNVLQKQIEDAQQEIVIIGLEQKGIIERLRQELKEYQKTLKTETTKNGIEEKRLNFANALNRNRKQNIITRSVSVTSISGSDDSGELPSACSSPEPSVHPLNPQDVSQTQFLHYFGLATHDVYKEMQNRRVERKRRSTANPQFLYGSRGWDYAVKRQKRGGYLVSSISPPNTRQSARNKKDRVSPTPKNGVESRKVLVPFPAIPNLPSGLTIERVSPNRSTPDPKICIACRQPGSTLSVCESCFNGFHISCHNRPLTQAPRHCPRCILNKEVRTVGALNVPSGMSVSYVSAADFSEKLEEKRALQEKHDSLSAELNQLKTRQSQLMISLKNQKSQHEELLSTQHTTRDKIDKLMKFLASFKSPAAQASAVQQPS